MKIGQLLGFILESLPEEAQQAFAALQAGAPPMAPGSPSRSCATSWASRRRSSPAGSEAIAAVDRAGAPRRAPQRA